MNDLLFVNNLEIIVVVRPDFDQQTNPRQLLGFFRYSRRQHGSHTNIDLLIHAG